MKIDSSVISMRSSHSSLQRVEVRESLEAWVGARPTRGASAPVSASADREPAATVRLSAAALEAAQRAVVSDPVAQQASNRTSELEAAFREAEADPRVLLLRTLVELLSGRRVRLLSDVEACSAPLEAPAPPPSQPTTPDNPPAPREDAGFGMQYEFHATRTEFEQSNVSARGVIRTSDGKEIAFELALQSQRSYSETVDVSLRAGNAVLKDPLVLNFGAPAAQLESTRFDFDLDDDGQAEHVPMLRAGSGYLALDRDGNGQIDSGRELFGPATGDGYAELATYDADNNGFIDEADPVFDQLRLWQPALEGTGTLETLAQRNVGAIALAHVASPFQLRDGDNAPLGAVRSTSVYLTEDGEARSVQQLDLSV